MAATTQKGTRKRVVDDESPSLLAAAVGDVYQVPRIIQRHQHRRQNIATSFWGPELPSTPLNPPVSASSASGPTPRFNIYKALLRHPNLFFQFALRLPYSTIISLYAIDKEFHYRLNKYSVSLIHDYARYHAPLASYIFSWVWYPNLCISDPMLRPMDGRAWLARDVPGFRWIGMVLWRQHVVRSILTELALEGHRVPSETEDTLMKFWCLMEMKTTSIRQAFLQDENIWTNEDLSNLQLFHIKLDMRFANPIVGNGACELGRLLLTQNSLSMLWKVLTGKLIINYDDITDHLVRTYQTDDLDTNTHPWLDDEIDNGIPEELWGLLTKEGWDTDGARMETAVDMVIVEGHRRQLHQQQQFLDYITYGYVDSGTWENIPLPIFVKKGNKIFVSESAWPAGRNGKAIHLAMGKLESA